MTADRNAPGENEPSSTPNQEELCRQLIEQFYEGSVGRYGIDSEQARILARYRSLPDPDGKPDPS
jgi:hypothetical protein